MTPLQFAPVLLAAVERVLTISDSSWQGILGEVAEEIEEAVDQDVSEASDRRDDLALASVVVFHDAVLLSFAAPRQFPDSWIRVQLDALLDHVSAAEDR
jgi:CRISPR/Cas system CMR subunit Cmr4 (Cas7 group RAMP superfamily)